MRILCVTNFFKPSWESGGPAKVAYSLCRNLVQMGHDVTVYTTDGFKWRANVKTNELVDIDGIKTYYFKNLSSYLAKRPLLTPYFLPVVARKDINNFDIIHVHDISALSLVVLHYANKYSVPYVIHAHGSIPFLKTDKRSIIGRASFSILERPILCKAAKAIALTRTEAKQYISIGVKKDRIEVIPNGVDLSEYSDLPGYGEFRRKFNIDMNEKIILYVGRINESKGIDLLLNAFSELLKSTGNVKLVLVGPDDGYLRIVHSMISDLSLKNNVILTGYVDIREKMAAFVDADLFVTPRFSGFPITFLEACICGKPLLTTTNGDELDWVNGRAGYVVNYNSKDLSNAILNLLADDQLRSSLGEEGKRMVAELFNWKTISESMYKIYFNVSNYAGE